MKKLFTLLIICLLFSGCKKTPHDYNKFLGNYNFVTSQLNWTINGVLLDTTYTYSGKVGPGSQNNTVKIYFSPNANVEATIYEDGTLDTYSCSHYDYLYGEFSSTNEINFFYHDGFGLGGGINYDVTGVKTQ